MATKPSSRPASKRSALTSPRAVVAVDHGIPAEPLPLERRTLNFGDKWNYAPAPETTKVTIDKRYELFIDGKVCCAEEREIFPLDQPRDGKEAGRDRSRQHGRCGCGSRCSAPRV